MNSSEVLQVELSPFECRILLNANLLARSIYNQTLSSFYNKTVDEIIKYSMKDSSVFMCFCPMY